MKAIKFKLNDVAIHVMFKKIQLTNGCTSWWQITRKHFQTFRLPNK